MKNRKKKISSQSLSNVAKDWGIDYQVFKIKIQLIDTIKLYCESHKISQRKLAAMVEGLSQDRVSKIFSGQISHMSIDKLVQILSVLEINVEVEAIAA